VLLFQITDLESNVLATAWDHNGGEVACPLSDSRTAKLTLPMASPIIRAGHGRALDRMLKVTYVPFDAEHGDDDYLVFWGVILTPNYNFSDGTVELNAHDPSIWWKKNNHRYGDYVVDEGYPIDGRGFRLLIESALPLPQQLARGVPHPGIYWGWNDVPNQGPKPADPANPAPGDGAYSVVQRGQQVWETVTQLCGQVDGPEWDLLPVDARHQRYIRDADTGTRSYAGVGAGYYVQLNTYEEKLVDRRASVAWHYGIGSQNLSELEWTPDGNAVVNYAVEVFPGGQSRRQDTQRRALWHNEASWLKYGIYEKWESSNAKDFDKRVLLAKAKAWVQAYNEPPSFFTATAQPEGSARAAPHAFMRDFELGDLMTVAGQRDGTVMTAVARCQKVTLTCDEKGLVTPVIEFVPHIDGDVSVGTDVETG
jgi:hypothetical protein